MAKRYSRYSWVPIANGSWSPLCPPSTDRIAVEFFPGNFNATLFLQNDDTPQSPGGVNLQVTQPYQKSFRITAEDHGQLVLQSWSGTMAANDVKVFVVETFEER